MRRATALVPAAVLLASLASAADEAFPFRSPALRDEERSRDLLSLSVGRSSADAALALRATIEAR